jgi:hypothetical protein
VMAALVYHHTEIARLPWILDAGALRPGRCTVGNYPDPDFLWGTVCAAGSRTAAIGNSPVRVRFALRADDFEKWSGVLALHPAWTADHVARLNRGARGDDPGDWRVRAAPLPLDRVLSIETRTRSTGWQLHEPRGLVQVNCDARGVLVGETMWLSQQITPADAPRKFRLRGMPLDAFVRWVERAAVIEPPPGMLPDGSLNIVGDAK